MLVTLVGVDVWIKPTRKKKSSGGSNGESSNLGIAVWLKSRPIVYWIL
jgi:hypothetical protein